MENNGTDVTRPRSEQSTKMSPRELQQLIQRVTKTPDQRLKCCRPHLLQLKSMFMIQLLENTKHFRKRTSDLQSNVTVVARWTALQLQDLEDIEICFLPDIRKPCRRKSSHQFGTLSSNSL